MNGNKANEPLVAVAASGIFLVLLPAGLLAIFVWIAREDFRTNIIYQSTVCTVSAASMIKNRPEGEDYTMYIPDITYEYNVGDSAFTSNRYDIWQSGTTDENEAVEIVSHYEVGGQFPCYYDPADPGRAVLVRTLSLKYLWALLPAVCLVAGIYAFVTFVRQWSRLRRNTQM